MTQDVFGPGDANNAIIYRPNSGVIFGTTDTWFRDCSNEATQDGTVIEAAFLNAIVANLRSISRSNGLKIDGVNPVVVQDNGDDLILRAFQQFVQRGQSLYGANNGTGDVAVVALNPVPAELVPGMQVLVNFNNANTTTSPTLSVNGFGPKPILKRNGGIPAIGDLNGPMALVLDSTGANWRLSGLAASDAPIIPTGSTVLIYVRTDGNDVTADGSANTSAKAFQTIAAAISFALSRYFLSGKYLVIQLGNPGTYIAPANINNNVNITLRGDPANQGSYVISGAGAGPGSCPIVALGCTLQCSGFTIINTGTLSDTLAASTGSTVYLDHITFQCSVSSSNYHMATYSTGSMSIGPGVVIAASMGGWLNSSGHFTFGTYTTTFLGTPAWSVAGVSATLSGNVSNLGMPTFSGSATGPRYYVSTNGTLSTNGGGPNYYPGSTAGTADTTNGGRYV